MDGVIFIPADRYRARRKLQDDALAQTLIGKLCEQVPEVFQTHVMPHLTDKDLRSLAFLGSEPRRVMRDSSRATALSSCYPRVGPMGYAVVEDRMIQVPQLPGFQVLDRFVGFDPDGSAYCRRCRLMRGPSYGKKNLKTLPALLKHAMIIATRIQHKITIDQKAHEGMFSAIDAVLGLAT